MFAASLLALLPLALSAAATPLAARQSDACAAFGSSGSPTRGRFLLAAYNTTLPNANHFGRPLSLVGAGASAGASSQKIVAADVFTTDAPRAAFVLDDGALQPFGTTSDTVSNSDVKEGSTIVWNQSMFGVQPATHAWCSVHTNLEIDAGVDVLAVNGDVDGFQICREGSWDNAREELVWRPTEQPSWGYVTDSCYPVRVHIILGE